MQSPPAPPARVGAVERRVAALELELDVRYSFVGRRYDRDFAALLRRLPRSTLLVDYARLPSGLHAFVGTGGGRVRSVRLAGGMPTNAIDDLLMKASSPTWGAVAVRRASAARARLLLGPLARDLARAADVVVIPDGKLHLLPFALLPDPDARALVRRHALIYLTGMAQLALPKAAPGSGGLALGDPDFALGRPLASATGPGGGHREPAPVPLAALPDQLVARGGDNLLGLRPLTASLAEVKAVHRIMHATMRVGPDATEHRLKLMIHGRRLVHLATHGLVARGSQDPWTFSGLALAGASTGGGGVDDGFLSAREVEGLDLRSADRVTLSACETGYGREQSGEGVLGLKLAFQIAGAPRTVVSLWKVADQATSVLMADFYRRIHRGMSVARSLRSAQIPRVRDSTWRQPYYWGGFIVCGRP